MILGLGDPLIGRILTVDTLDMSSGSFKLQPDPANEVTWENRDRIEVQGTRRPLRPRPRPLTDTRVVETRTCRFSWVR